MSGTPAAEVEVDEALVSRLLLEQHPDLAALPIRAMEAGWDNMMFRLGDSLTVRMPRRLVAAGLVVNEQDWLPALSANLPISVPSPLRIGQPGCSYPWRWSVLPWLQGNPADEAPPHASQAPLLAEFLRSLHRFAPANAPVNAVRGCALQDRGEAVAARLEQLKQVTSQIGSEIEAAWTAALAAPQSQEDRWIHGDLHARNVLVEDGAISAIIDWGDITSGDVATDLAGIWGLFEEAEARRTALQVYGATEPEIARARGWAVNLGTILLATGLVDNPRHAAMGSDMLRRVAGDFAAGW